MVCITWMSCAPLFTNRIYSYKKHLAVLSFITFTNKNRSAQWVRWVNDRMRQVHGEPKPPRLFHWYKYVHLRINSLKMKSTLFLGLALGYKHVFRRDAEGERMEALCDHASHTGNKFQWRICDGDNYLSCGNAPWPRAIKIECGEGKTCKDTTDPSSPLNNAASCIWKADA